MEGDIVTSFRESVETSAPPNVVWDLITDIRRHAEFAGPKSITKVIDFEGPVAVGSRWISHEKFGPLMKEENRGKGGRVLWGYELSPATGGTRLEHYMTVLEPRKGAAMLKALYKVLGLPTKQVPGGRTTVENIRKAAEQET